MAELTIRYDALRANGAATLLAKSPPPAAPGITAHLVTRGLLQPEPALTVQAGRSRSIRFSDGALRMVKARPPGQPLPHRVDRTAPVHALTIGHTLPHGSPAVAP